MKTISRLPLTLLSLSFMLFLLTVPPVLQAQQKNARDTIAFILRHQKNPIQRCNELYALGNYYWNSGDAENALLAVNQCKAEAEKCGYDKGIYDSYSIMGAIHLKQNDIKKVLSISQECLQLATRKHSEYGVNKANYLLAVMFYRQGNIDSVISISRKALEAPYLAYDSVTLPKFNAMLGNAYLGRGDIQRANTHYLRALEVAEKTNDEQLQGVCIGNLAIINDELQNHREALKYQQRAGRIAQKYNQVQQLAGAYLSMGTCYKNLSLMDSAIYFYQKSLALNKQFGAREEIAITHSNLGGVLVSTGRVDSGMYYLRLAKAEFASLQDTFNMANHALSMGTAWRMMPAGRNEKPYLHQALGELLFCKNIAEQKNIEDLKMKCYKELSVVQEALGNWTQAFVFLKKYNEINDSIRSQEYTRQIAEMQTRFETEKKELEIKKLNAENLLSIEKIARQKILNYLLLLIAALILISGYLIFRNVHKKRAAEKQVAILEKQNAIENMRSKIASDVHDEMGANLTRLGLNAQQILQSEAVPNKERLLAEKMASQSREIIIGMREIIWASNPANDNLKSMLGFMRQYIDRFFDGINIRPIVNFPHDAGEVTLHPEVRRNLFLILKESLNNAVKHSGSDRIDIEFNTDNEKFQFTVKDYGQGIEDKKKNDFSSGMRNMQLRAEQIQSLFTLISAPGKGVQITVEGKLY